MGTGSRRWNVNPKDPEEVADPLLARERVRQRKVRLDRVVVASASSSTRDIARLLELSDDPMRRSFGDPDALPDLAQADARIVRDAQEHLGMVGEKSPFGQVCVRHNTRIAFLDSNFSYSRL